jgi:hypothetical protein
LGIARQKKMHGGETQFTPLQKPFLTWEEEKSARRAFSYPFSSSVDRAHNENASRS